MNNKSTLNSTEQAKKSPEQKKQEFLYEIFSSIEMFCICICAVILLFTFVFRLTVVDGISMENTLKDGEYLVVRSAFYEPKQGDIVIVHDKSLSGIYSDPLIKRVIAVGGQTIDIDFDTWTVTVDGQVLDESYIKLDPTKKITSTFTYPLTVPEGEVFVMGDNRNNSGDSRSASVGTVDEECIVGKAFLRILPYDRFGLLKNPLENN